MEKRLEHAVTALIDYMENTNKAVNAAIEQSLVTRQIAKLPGLDEQYTNSLHTLLDVEFATKEVMVEINRSNKCRYVYSTLQYLRNMYWSHLGCIESEYEDLFPEAIKDPNIAPNVTTAGRIIDTLITRNDEMYEYILSQFNYT